MDASHPTSAKVVIDKMCCSLKGSPRSSITPMANEDALYPEDQMIEMDQIMRFDPSPDSMDDTAEIGEQVNAENPVLQPIESGNIMAPNMKNLLNGRIALASTDVTPTSSFTISSTSTIGSGSSCTKCTRSGCKSKHGKQSSTRFNGSFSSYLRSSDGQIWGEIILPSGLPKSEVLNEKNTFTEQLRALYEKYIKTGAEQEINISGYQRRIISELFDKVMTPSKSYAEQFEADMFSVMDAACIEVLSILPHSYHRFLKTSKGHSIVQSL